MSTEGPKFTKGQKVKATIKHRGGTTVVTGTVTALPPSAERGKNRFTVKDGEGKEWKPYASQLAAA